MIDEGKIDRIKAGKPYSLFDIIAILVSLCLCVAVITVTCANKREGSTLVITQVSEGITTEYSLSEDQEIRITVEKGEIVVEIKDGAARVISSPCTGQDCVHMPAIRYAGQSITCADCRVNIIIKGQSNFTPIQ